MDQPNPIDLRKLLTFFRDAYAHAMTLQQMMENHLEWVITEDEYDRFRAGNDLYAEQQFDLIFRAVNDPESFGKAVQAFLDKQPKNGRVQ